VVQEGAAEVGVAGDAVEFGHALQAVQAFPARPGRAEELFALEPLAIVVAGLLEVLQGHLRHAEIARLSVFR